MAREGHAEDLLMAKFASEKEMAEIVVQWLLNHRWEVYQEVPVGTGVADIVAKQGPVTWLIETKLSMSMQLLHQLDDRVAHANLVSAAIPPRARKNAPYKLLRTIGAGLITVFGESWVREELRPRFYRKTAKIELHEEQKTFSKAGSQSGGCWTPFKDTTRNVQVYVRNNPGCTMSEMLAKIKYHYSSISVANSSIVSWIEADVIKGIRIDRSKRPLKLYPVEEIRA